MAEDKKSFEQAMVRLEEIVTILERGEAPLETSLSLFEEGTALMSQCSTALDYAEQKVAKLSKGLDGQAVEKPIKGEGSHD